MICDRCISYFRQLRSASFSEYLELGEAISKSLGKESAENIYKKAKAIREKFSGQIGMNFLSGMNDTEKLEALCEIFPNTRITKTEEGNILFSIDECLLKASVGEAGLGEEEQYKAEKWFCFEETLLRRCFLILKLRIVRMQC